MINKIENLNVIASELHSILVEKDYFFVENISLCDLGGTPFLNAIFEKGSSGAVTYTSELNTYFSPSFAFLAKNNNEFFSTLSAVFQLMKELENIHNDLGTSFENEYKSQLSKAVSGSLNNHFNDLKTSDDVNVSYYQEIDTYYDEKTSYHQPYCIDALNFKKMENEGDFKSMFSAAMFAKSIVGNFDFLMFATHGENSFLAKELTRMVESQKENFLFGYYIDNLTKKIENLLTIIKEEEQKHIALEQKYS